MYSVSAKDRVLLHVSLPFGGEENHENVFIPQSSICQDQYIYEGESIKPQPNLFLGEINLFFFDAIAL